MQDLIISSSALQVELADYGARLLSVTFARNESPVSVLLGYDNVEAYLHDRFYMGAVIGPIANRVCHGQFQIGETDWQLPLNEGDHSLHSGAWGYDQQIWTVSEQTTDSVSFQLQANHTAAPRVEVRYRVLGASLIIDLTANCDAPCYLNMTSHAYWNLAGPQRSIDDHRFEILANRVAITDEDNIPAGEEIQFSPPLICGSNFAESNVVADLPWPLDHHFTVSEQSSELKPLVDVTSSLTGVSMRVSSTKPGFQFYCGQYLDAPFEPMQGFCVEPQFLPNAINLPGRLAPLIDADHPYRHRIKFEFSSS